MTFKKCNIIIYFIILSNLVVNVIIAQKTIEPSTGTETPSGEAGKNVTENCLENVACIHTNETIRLCNGRFKGPNSYIAENTKSGTYKPEDRGLARCMCNQQYYDNLSACLECFNTASGTKFEASPLEEYKKECKDLGTTFTEILPEKIPSTIPSKVKWGVLGGLGVVIFSVIGVIIFKYYKRKKVSVEGDGTKKPMSYTPQSEYYPPPPGSQSSPYLPPQSDQYPPPQSGHYPSPQSGHYPPPQGGHYPPPQGDQYPPPQGDQYPPPPQQHGSQGDRVGGQSDSYYNSNF